VRKFFSALAIGTGAALLLAVFVFVFMVASTPRAWKDPLPPDVVVRAAYECRSACPQHLEEGAVWVRQYRFDAATGECWCRCDGESEPELISQVRADGSEVREESRRCSTDYR
jgi:hypothetical protein